jgi:hypothetical protein
MKKTYTAPTLIVSGDVVQNTLIGDVPGKESPTQLAFLEDLAGSIGYYL